MSRQRDLDQLLWDLRSFLLLLDRESLSAAARAKKRSVSALLARLQRPPPEDAEYMIMRCLSPSPVTPTGRCSPGSGSAEAAGGGGRERPHGANKEPGVPPTLPADDSYEDTEPPEHGGGDSDSSHYESYGEEEEEEEEDGGVTDRAHYLRWPAGTSAEPPEPPGRPEAQLCGFLWRKRWLGRWAKQLFIVREHVLLCFRCAADLQPLLQLDLRGCRVSCKDKRGKKMPHALKVAGRAGEVLVIGFQSRQQAEDWRKVIEEVSSDGPSGLAALGVPAPPSSRPGRIRGSPHRFGAPPTDSGIPLSPLRACLTAARQGGRGGGEEALPAEPRAARRGRQRRVPGAPAAPAGRAPSRSPAGAGGARRCPAPGGVPGVPRDGRRIPPKPPRPHRPARPGAGPAAGPSGPGERSPAEDPTDQGGSGAQEGRGAPAETPEAEQPPRCRGAAAAPCAHPQRLHGRSLRAPPASRDPQTSLVQRGAAAAAAEPGAGSARAAPQTRVCPARLCQRRGRCPGLAGRAQSVSQAGGAHGAAAEGREGQDEIRLRDQPAGAGHGAEGAHRCQRQLGWLRGLVPQAAAEALQLGQERPETAAVPAHGREGKCDAEEKGVGDEICDVRTRRDSPGKPRAARGSRRTSLKFAFFPSVSTLQPRTFIFLYADISLHT
nr:collagen alpha-1(I) chain isoform X3 [Taeniopygia guttata]